VKVYPTKGYMDANHEKLMSVLDEIQRHHKVDVVITPEGFLDGYVSTVKSVTKADMVKYAVDPDASSTQQAGPEPTCHVSLLDFGRAIAILLSLISRW